MPKLTKTTVDRAKCPAEKAKAIVWDGDIPGYGLAVYRSGRKSYVMKYSLHGRARWHTLGEHGPLTPTQARQRALKARGLVADGIDPAAERQRARAQQTTIAELVGEYVDTLLVVKPSTRSAYRQQLAHVLPKFGSMRPDAITVEDVRRWHRSMADTPSMANHALDRLSTVMAEAERRELRPAGANPCRSVKRYPEQPRTRFLSSAELARLGNALRALEGARNGISPAAAGAIRILLLTGTRVSEVLGLRWQDIDFERGVANLADAKAGPRPVLLPAPALEVLKELRRAAPSEWVIPGQKPDRPMVHLRAPWQRVREAAGLENVRLHDLRHTVGAWGASGGASLLVVGKILGHRDAATTQIYAHLADEPVRAASEKIGAAIAAALATEPDDAAAEGDGVVH